MVFAPEPRAPSIIPPTIGIRHCLAYDQHSAHGIAGSVFFGVAPNGVVDQSGIVRVNLNSVLSRRTTHVTAPGSLNTARSWNRVASPARKVPACINTSPARIPAVAPGLSGSTL